MITFHYDQFGARWSPISISDHQMDNWISPLNLTDSIGDLSVVQPYHDWVVYKFGVLLPGLCSTGTQSKDSQDHSIHWKWTWCHWDQGPPDYGVTSHNHHHRHHVREFHVRHLHWLYLQTRVVSQSVVCVHSVHSNSLFLCRICFVHSSWVERRCRCYDF
jgi:hypothetical protein